MSESKNSRRPFVGGNWKCNPLTGDIDSLVSVFNKGTIPKDVDVVIAPTALHLLAVREKLTKDVHLAAQNCSATGNGAFTGEISVEQLIDVGVEWVILGHSERRHKFNEECGTVGVKVQRALSLGLNVIACIGETREERESGDTQQVVIGQTKRILDAVCAAAEARDKEKKSNSCPKGGNANVGLFSRVVIAYEPVWAIGTGLTATPQQAQSVHSLLRKYISSYLSEKECCGKHADLIAGTVRIIYGGSVKAKNAASLFQQADIDGFLVGGASLKPQFLDIMAAASSTSSH